MTEQDIIERLEFELNLRKQSLATGRKILFKDHKGVWLPRFNRGSFERDVEYKLADPEPEFPKEAWIEWKSIQGFAVGSAEHFETGKMIRYVHEDKIREIVAEYFDYASVDPAHSKREFDLFLMERKEGRAEE